MKHSNLHYVVYFVVKCLQYIVVICVYLEQIIDKLNDPRTPIIVLSFKIVFYTDHLFSDHTHIDTLQISTSRCYIKAVSSDLCNWIYWHWQRIPSQVQVNSTDPNLSLGVLHLLAKDTSDKSSGTSYYLIENGSGIYRSIEFHDLNLQSLHY